MMGLSLVAINSSLNASCESYYCKDVKVNTLYPDESGKIYVATSGNADNVTSCNLLHSILYGDYAYISPNARGKREMYSTLLAAHRDGKNITIRFSRDHMGACRIAYVISQR